MRRQSRELALQILFQTEFTNPIPLSEFLALYAGTVSEDAMEYTRALVQGIQSNKEKIDSIIQTASSHWKVQRMALVDRNVLRIAIFEMKISAHGLEPQIAINEAIELAKKYGSTDSGGFVNGVLDQIAKGNSWQ